MNATLSVLVLAENWLKAPFGKNDVSPNVLEPLPDSANGTVPSTVCRRLSGSTCISNIPNPPRIAVLPLRKGSQENPMRGSKSRKDGLANKRRPGDWRGVGQVMQRCQLAVNLGWHGSHLITQTKIQS